MRVGISTRYCFHEATYAALRIADLVQQLGHDVRIDSVNSPPALDSRWDKRVSSAKYLELAPWAEMLIWTHVPTLKEIWFWQKNSKAKLAIVPMWHELIPKDKKQLGRVNHIIAPHHSLNVLQKRWPGQWAAVPWDNGLPVTRKEGLRHEGRVYVLAALFDDVINCLNTTFIDEIARILKACPNAYFTLAYCASRMARPAMNRFRGLATSFGERCQLAAGVALRDRPLLYARHDVTLWPTVATDIGCVGLDSLTMGTPVVTWQCPPVDEFLRPDNAILVSCDVEHSEQGVPSSDGNCYRLGIALQQLIENPPWIVTMQKHTAAKLEARRGEFVRFWAKLFEDS
jgi:hypothetical protein